MHSDLETCTPVSTGFETPAPQQAPQQAPESVTHTASLTWRASSTRGGITVSFHLKGFSMLFWLPRSPLIADAVPPTPTLGGSVPCNSGSDLETHRQTLHGSAPCNSDSGSGCRCTSYDAC
eukprot:125841-Chlamydomonas_euryale.AAC.2